MYTLKWTNNISICLPRILVILKLKFFKSDEKESPKLLDDVSECYWSIYGKYITNAIGDLDSTLYLTIMVCFLFFCILVKWVETYKSIYICGKGDSHVQGGRTRTRGANWVIPHSLFTLL